MLAVLVQYLLHFPRIHDEYNIIDSHTSFRYIGRQHLQIQQKEIKETCFGSLVKILIWFTLCCFAFPSTSLDYNVQENDQFAMAHMTFSATAPLQLILNFSCEALLRLTIFLMPAGVGLNTFFWSVDCIEEWRVNTLKHSKIISLKSTIHSICDTNEEKFLDFENFYYFTNCFFVWWEKLVRYRAL